MLLSHVEQQIRVDAQHSTVHTYLGVLFRTPM